MAIMDLLLKNGRKTDKSPLPVPGEGLLSFGGWCIKTLSFSNYS